MFADGMSQCEAAGVFRAWSGLLDNWREATRTLQEELTDGQPLSTAGRRYLEYELAGWKQAQRNTAPWSSNTRSEPRVSGGQLAMLEEILGPPAGWIGIGGVWGAGDERAP